MFIPGEEMVAIFCGVEKLLLAIAQSGVEKKIGTRNTAFEKALYGQRLRTY